jgi:hypothetical protein
MKSFFESNLSQLARADPDLAARMRRVPWPHPGLTLFPGRSGAPTLKAVGHDGVEILLHSEYDPVREAAQFLDVRKLDKNDAYTLNGFGLGYLALAAAARFGSRSWIGCVEAQEGLFRAALEGVDLTPLFARERLRFFVGQDWSLFQRWLRSFLIDSGAMNMGVVAYPPCLRLQPKFYGDVARELEVGANYRRMDWNTLLRFGRDIDRNAIRNLPVMIRSHGVRCVENLFAGLPAVVVGAGPSLNTAIPHLRRAAGKAVILSVGRALKRLIREEIVPQFVVTLDMGEEVVSFFRGFEIPPRVVHLFDMDSYFGASATFPGPGLTYQTLDPFSRWTAGFLGSRGTLEKGSTVAHSAFQLAHFMGCRPILLVGVDLAFPGEKTHADGVPQSWGGRTEEQTLDWVMIPGTQGKPVRSDTSFASYVTGFEMQIAKSGAQVIQTSEIGAMIRGSESLPLDHAVERYATAPAPLQEKLGHALSGTPLFDRPAFEEAARRLLEGLDRTIRRSDDMLHLLSQVRRLDVTNRLDQQEILKKLGKAKEEEGEILRDREVFPFFGRVIAPADYEIRLLNHKVESLSVDDPERLRVYTRMFEVSFTGFRDAAQFLRDEFRPVRDQVLGVPGPSPGG